MPNFYFIFFALKEFKVYFSFGKFWEITEKFFQKFSYWGST